MKKKRKKKTALVVCRDRKQFWTTQAQFWQWVRDGVVDRTRPLCPYPQQATYEGSGDINMATNFVCK